MALIHVDPQLSSDAATLDLTTSPAPGTTNWLSVTNFGERNAQRRRGCGQACQS